MKAWHYLLVFLFLLAAWFLFFHLKVNDGGIVGGAGPGEVALKSLATVRKLADGQHYSRMGFHLPEEVHDLSLGDPLRVMKLRLDRIHAFDSTRIGKEDWRALTFGSGEVIYPVKAGGKLRTSLTVDSITGKKEPFWVLARVGDAKLILDLDSAIRKASAQSGQPASAYYAVTIPSLYLTFLAHGTGESWTPIFTPSGFSCGWKTGRGEDSLACFQEGEPIESGRALVCLSKCIDFYEKQAKNRPAPTPAPIKERVIRPVTK